MADVAHSEDRVVSKDGTRLYCQSWTPAEDPRAALLIVHGLFEHSGRYGHVARWATDRGFACYALDYRAHGKSPGLRVHVDRFEEFVEDVEAMRARVAEAHPSLPRFILGHSQGGLITILSILAEPEGLAGAVLSSPFLGVHPESRPPAPVVALAPLMSRIVPRLRVDGGAKPDYLCHDREVVDAYKADPLVSSKISTRFGTEVMAAQERALAEAGRLALPTLLMFAGDDHVVDPAATRRWAQAAPSSQLEVVEWERLWHELLNEPEKGEVLDRIGRFLDARLAAVAA